MIEPITIAEGQADFTVKYIQREADVRAKDTTIGYWLPQCYKEYMIERTSPGTLIVTI